MTIGETDKEQMDVDAKEFKTTTWGKITQLIGDIKSYADDQAASSYPREMLKIVREYNEENDKPDPDHVRLSALKQNMQSTAKAVIAGFDEPRAKRETAVKTFGDFETACGNYVFKTDKGRCTPQSLDQASLELYLLLSTYPVQYYRWQIESLQVWIGNTGGYKLLVLPGYPKNCTVSRSLTITSTLMGKYRDPKSYRTKRRHGGFEGHHG